MQHRRLMILFAIISLFAFGVIIWYFLFSTPQSSPTLQTTANPLGLRDLPARIGFIFNGGTPPEQTTQTEVTPQNAQPFIQVWDKPTTGNVFVSRSILQDVTATTTIGTTTMTTMKTVRATSTVLLFVDRITGYVYGHSIESGATYQISNTTVPGVYDAYFFNGGNQVLMRYLDADRKTIISIVGTVPQVQEGQDAEPLENVTTLPENITSVAVSQSLASLSYLVDNDLGASIYTLTTKGSSKVGDTPYSEWLLSYGGENLFATTKPSAYVEGYTVSLPSFSKILSNKTGLLALPTQSGFTLASMWSQTGLLLFAGQNGAFKNMNLQTLAPKCAFMTTTFFVCGAPSSVTTGDEGLPDDWYQGRVSFADSLVTLDASTGLTEHLYDFDQKYGPIDVTHISLGKAGQLISFIRKQDGALFLLNTSLLDNE